MVKRLDFARQATQLAYKEPVSKNAGLILSDTQTNRRVLNVLLALLRIH